MEIDDALPRMSENANAFDAIAWVRAITKWIGPGFHPDTRGNDYVSDSSGTPTFAAAEAAALDRDLERAFALLAARGRDPYEVAIKVQRRLLG